MKKSVKIWLGVLVLIILALVLTLFFNKYIFIFHPDFELDSNFLKVALSEGSCASNTLKITNINGVIEPFRISVIGFDNLISLESYEFSISPGETYNLEVKFNTTGIEPGVYLGKIFIDSDSTKKELPVILEIQSKDVLFDSNINLYPPGTEVYQGQKLSAEVKIFDLSNLGRTSLDFEYYISDFDGNKKVSEQENIIISSGSFERPINLDLGDSKLGSYVLVVVLKYGDSVGISTLLFNIVESKNIEGITERFISYIIILFSLFFLMFLGLFVYSFLYRDKLLRELQSQYKNEIAKQRELISSQMSKGLVRLKDKKERQKYLRELDKVKKQRINALNDIRKRKIAEFRVIKRKYKGNDLKLQLEMWKKKGYDTSILEKRFKLPSVNEMKKQISDWKKKGYNTKVLNKKR